MWGRLVSAPCGISWGYLTGAGDFTPKTVHSRGWQVGADGQLGAQLGLRTVGVPISLYLTLPQAGQPSSCLDSKSEYLKRTRQKLRAFSNLASNVK